MLKKVLFIGMTIATIHFAWAGYSLYSFGQALRSNNAIAIEPQVDWVRLRQSIKASFTMELAKKSDPNASAGEQLGIGLGLLFADKMLESFVSPAGLAELFSTADDQSDDKPLPIKRYYLNGAPDAINIEFESGVTACFEMVGIRWKLVSLWGLDRIHDTTDASFPKTQQNSEGISQERPTVFVNDALEQQAEKYIEEQRKQLDTLLQEPEPKESPEH